MGPWHSGAAVRVCTTMLSLAIAALVKLPATASGLHASGEPRSVGGNEAARAVVIWDELRVYEEAGADAPGGTVKTIARAERGDIILALGARRQGRLQVQVGDVTGWAFQDGVVELSAPRADARLLAAARRQEGPGRPPGEPDHLAALALYSRHLELFPASAYSAFALYRYGRLAQRLAGQATREAEQRLSRTEKASDTSYIEWKGLAKYTKWGLNFRWSHLGGYYYYGGEAYRTILEDHRASEWADNAAYQLLRLERTESGEWEGFPGGPLKEPAQWRGFITQYPTSELKPDALLEMVYLHRVLYEIFSIQQGAVDERQAREHRTAATGLAGIVQREFPGTEHAARAETHLAEIELGKHVYIIAAGAASTASALARPAAPDQAPPIQPPSEGSAAPPEARRPDWAPQHVPARFARTAQMVHRFVVRVWYRRGRDAGAGRELLAQGSTRAEADLRGLLRELPPTDRFRFMVAFTMYWLGFDLASSRAVMLEYCPPRQKPGYSEETLAFLDYAHQKRPDWRLLEGLIAWVLRADGCAAEMLHEILPEKARSHPRHFLAALRDKPLPVWNRAGHFLAGKGESPEHAYPALVAIADHGDDPLSGLARQLLREVASSWPAPSQYPPPSARTAGVPAAAGLPFHDLALLTPPIEVNGEWYVPAREFCTWLRAGLTVSGDMSSLTITWRRKSHTWTRESGRLVFHAGTAFIPIHDVGTAFGERVGLREDGRVIDLGTPAAGRVCAAIPVGWRKPMPPEGLSPDEMEIWRRLLRPDAGPVSVRWEPYDIRIAGRWAAAKIRPLNVVTDDALVLLDGRWGAWRIITLGTDLPAAGRNWGIPAEARKQLGLPF